MNTNSVLYKKLESMQIAYIQAQISERDQILPLLNRVRITCGDAIIGHPFVIFHGGAVKDGFLVDAAYPVCLPVEMGDVHSRKLEAVSAVTMLHHGPHQTIRETVQKIYDFLDTHAWTSSLFRREIYCALDPAQPENNITEVQIILHEWEKLFAEKAESALGSEVCQQLTTGVESISPDTTFDEYTEWIRSAIERLDALDIDNEKKCQVVSHCAHVFPEERIDYLRNIYQNGEFDDILRDMYNDNFWYEKPVRRGNVLYMRKNPYDPEGYKNAITPAERRKAYCHCSFVHPYLENVPSKLSPTFCFCGAGWYRRLWEGILGQPVKFEFVETLLDGNDQCTFTITLPIKLEGEFTS